MNTTRPPAVTTAYLGLGSNLGDSEAQIEQALNMINTLPNTHITRRSPLYWSKPWGKTNQPDFLNMVAEVSTSLEPSPLLEQCKVIESALGREPGERWGPRPIDIDILLYGDIQVRTDTLIVPHKRMWERQFVLRPLADLLPDLHSPDNTPIKQVLEQDDIASQGVSEYRLERTRP